MFNSNLCFHLIENCNHCAQIQSRDIREIADQYKRGNKLIDRLWYLKSYHEKSLAMARNMGNAQHA